MQTARNTGFSTMDIIEALAAPKSCCRHRSGLRPSYRAVTRRLSLLQGRPGQKRWDNFAKGQPRAPREVSVLVQKAVRELEQSAHPGCARHGF